MKKLEKKKQNKSDESKDNYLTEFIFELWSGKVYEEYYGNNNSEFLRISEYEYYHAFKNLYDDIDVEYYWQDVEEHWWD